MRSYLSEGGSFLPVVRSDEAPAGSGGHHQAALYDPLSGIGGLHESEAGPNPGQPRFAKRPREVRPGEQRQLAGKSEGESCH